MEMGIEGLLQHEVQDVVSRGRVGLIKDVGAC